jgi:hypothetical protein
VVLLALGCGAPVASAHTAPVGRLGARARTKASVSRAPSGPPLVASGVGLGEDGIAGADASSSASPSGGDPLVENGLGSPLCGAAASGLSAASRRNCATSGFEAAGAPTGNYALDVHIDTGALGFTAATLEQDYLIGPVWMGLVWVVHTLIVALEWCFTLDLLSSSAMAGVERALSDTQAAFTRPWLVLALALASLAAAYNGLVRRRVAETLGQAALMLAMMAGGLWVIADPSGTVGALGRWVDEASAGTLGAVVEGTPQHAPRTLADSMGGLFAGVVGAPWCYLEFGDVRWCVEPALLDPRLHTAALALAAGAQPADGCDSGGVGDPEAVCQALAGEQSRARAQSATLLRAARTNGELFLALPADEAARNSINDEDSLLRVLCGSEHATGCRGPTAPEAEFRTQGGTVARLGGLLLIVLGALGMLLLLGYIALHLLGAELLSLLYLLLAPAAVIAPALGDGGRAAFRAWATRLVGAVASKLVFSFLLGVVLLLTRTLLELYALGWWTRWLLVSAMWWGAYYQRRSVLGFVHGELAASGAGRRPAGRHAAGAAHAPGGGRAPGGGPEQPGRHDSLARRVRRQFETPLAALEAAQQVRRRLAKPAPSVERRQARERAGSERARADAGRQQAMQMLEREHAQALADVAGAPRAEVEVERRRAQLQRVQSARGEAVAAGEQRRAARLGVRARRIEGEIDGAQLRLSTARQTAAEGERARRAMGRRYTRADIEQRGRFLDAQAALPAGARSGAGVAGDRSAPGGRSRSAAAAAGGGTRRDYPALASLVGYGREQYERLDARHQREARLQIDRELALRRESSATATAGPRWSAAEAQGRGGSAPAGSGRGGSALVPGPVELARQEQREQRSQAPRVRGGHRAGGTAGRESSVMRDAREVARRRKRQLGG